MRSSIPGRLANAIGTALVVLLAGCSALSPQIFSERLMVPQGSHDSGAAPQAPQPPKDLDEAYADAAHVQSLYLTAVRDQGNLTPRLAAGLLGLSAVALYQGLTSPSTHALAAFGALGAAAYGYGSLVLSPARLDVYRAGAEALSCAMVAVEPLRVGQTRLGQPGDAAEKNTLYGGIAKVRRLRDELQALLDSHAALLEATVVDVPKREASSRTVKRRAPACDPAPDTKPEILLVLKAQCERQPTVETVVTAPAIDASTDLRAAPAALREADANARRELARAGGSIDRAEAAFKALAAAGPLLWHQSVRIQLAVSAEVDKTIPDLAAVLRTAQSLPDTAFALTGHAGFAKKTPATGDAQGAARQRPPTAADKKAEYELLAATTALAQASFALDAMTWPLAGVTERATREQVNACAVRTSGVELKVTPSGEEIPVARGGMAVFFVSGGGGVPSATVAVGPQAEVAMRVEGGQFRFEYRPPDAARPGDAVVLRFNGGNGGHQFVMLRVVEAQGTDTKGNTGAKTDASADPETTPKAPGANTSRPAKP